MITNIETISQQDAAVILRMRLGSIRVWSAFLADCNRDRQHVNGCTLMPCACVRGRGGKRPVYERAAVLKFIEDVLASTPDAGPSKMKVTAFEIDDAIPWELNLFDRAGKPVRRKCGVYVGAGRGAGAGYGAGARKPTISTRRGGGSAPYTMH